jgi:hypothetical protein
MNEIVVKYNKLDKSARQELNDFMDFLLSKQIKENPGLLTTYKNRILKVSVWSASDLKIFDENQKLLNNWKICS